MQANSVYKLYPLYYNVPISDPLSPPPGAACSRADLFLRTVWEAVPAEDRAPVAHDHPRQWWRSEVCLPGLQRIVHLAAGVGGPRSHPWEVAAIRLWPVREAVCRAALLPAAHEASHCTSHEAEAPGSGFWDANRYWWVVASSSSFESCSFSSWVHFSSRWNLCAWQRLYQYMCFILSLRFP